MMRRPGWRRRRTAAPYLFLAPFLLLFAVFLAYPLGRSLAMSFTQTIGPRDRWFVGLDNYLFLLRDRVFWLGALNTVGFAVVFPALQLPASLALALLLNVPAVYGRTVLRFAFFSTYLVGPVFAAVIFAVLLDTRAGLVNRALGWVLARPVEIPWLSSPRLAMLSVLLAALWLGIGFGMVYLLAALRALDRQLFDAAAVDGAGAWRRFWHVTLPGLRPALAFMVLVGSIASLQLFELPYVLFGGAGPGRATMTIVMYLFVTGFQAGNLGYASAIGWMLVALVALAATVPLALLRRARRLP